MENPDHSTSKFAVSKTFTVGDIAVCVTLFAAGFASFSSVDKRVTITEQTVQRMEQDLKSNSLENKVDQKETQKTLSELRSDMLRLTYSVERLAKQGKSHGSD